MQYFFESVYTLNVKIVCKISGGTNTEQEIVFSWLNAMYTCKFKLLVIIINMAAVTLLGSFSSNLSYSFVMVYPV